MPSTKKLAVIAKGYYRPLHFYKTIAKQYLPSDWSMDLFYVGEKAFGERRPVSEKVLKEIKKRKNIRSILDSRFYKKTVSTNKELEDMGWRFEEPDLSQYDLVFTSKDDNLILNYQLFHNVITGEEYPNWNVMTNSGNKESFCFTKKDGAEKEVSMSPCPRVSFFCIEGEDGFISNGDSEEMDRGILTLQSKGII